MWTRLFVWLFRGNCYKFTTKLSFCVNVIRSLLFRHVSFHYLPSDRIWTWRDSRRTKSSRSWNVVWAVDVILCRKILLLNISYPWHQIQLKKKIPIKNGKFLWPTRTKINFQKNFFDIEWKSSSTCWQNWTRQLQKVN